MIYRKRNIKKMVQVMSQKKIIDLIKVKIPIIKRKHNKSLYIKYN